MTEEKPVCFGEGGCNTYVLSRCPLSKECGETLNGPPFFAFRRKLQDLAMSQKPGGYDENIQTMFLAMLDLAIAQMGEMRTQALVKSVLERPAYPQRTVPDWLRGVVEGRPDEP